MTSKQLRIANISEDGRSAGPQHRIAIIAKYLKEMDIDTVVILPKQDSVDFRNRLDSFGIEYVPLTIHRLTKQYIIFIKYIIYFVPEVISIIRVLRRKNIDIVHCNGAWQFKGVFAGWIARKKVIWHMNDASMPAVIKALLKIVSLTTDGYIYSSVRTKDYYFPWLQARPHRVILPPVDTELLYPKIKKTENNILSREGINIIAVGNVNPGKGYDDFIEAISLINKTGNYYNYYIIGPIYQSQNKYARHLKKSANQLNLDNIHFLGLRSDVDLILDEADIFVCPSHYESGPMSVFEAMSKGLSIVSTDVGDVSQLLENKKSGFIVNCRDIQEIANSIIKLAKDENLRRDLGILSRQEAVKKLDVKTTAWHHKQLYEQVSKNTNN